MYPPPDKEQVPLTRLQERLLKKLGKDAYPFIFEVFLVCEINFQLTKMKGHVLYSLKLNLCISSILYVLSTATSRLALISNTPTSSW